MIKKISVLFLLCFLSGTINDSSLYLHNPKKLHYSNWISDIFFISSCNAQDAKVQTNAAEKAQKEDRKPKSNCINIDSVKLKGNTSFSSARLKMRMKTWHSSMLPGNLNCYNEDWLNKDILSLIEFYRKKGFPDVEADYRLESTDDGEQIIEITVNEGLEYKITFNGNSFFSDRELRKKIDLVKKGNRNDAALRRANVDIKNIYLDAGFQDVTVEFRKEKRDGKKVSEPVQDKQQQKKEHENIREEVDSDKISDEEQIQDGGVNICYVEFVINEGTRMVVRSLEIKNNKKVTKNEIMPAILTRQKGTLEKGGYNSTVLDKDINAIELLYLSKGLLNVTVSKTVTVEALPSEKLVDIGIDIDEGTQTLVKSVRITGIKDTISAEKVMAKLSHRPGEPFREYMVKSDENAIGMMVSELGYPHVRVRSTVEMNSDKSEADLVWHVEKGQFTKFGNIHYSGNVRLKEDVIERRVNIEPGTPFSLKKVLTTEKSIRESSAVKYVQVKAPGLARMETSPDIEVVIEENKPYFVEAATGYDTEQNFYFDTKIGDNNFLGREIDAWVSAKISGIGYRSEAGLKKPFFLGTQISATSNIYIEDQEELNKNFGTKSWGYETGFSRHLFTNNLMAGLNFKYENRTTYGDIEDIDLEEQKPRNILVTSFSLGYDSRDSSVRPSKGMLSTASVDVYAGFDNDLDRFLKYQLDLRKYISPFNKVTFALRTRMGYIQPFGSEDTVAQDQLFFLGGTSNVRGFKENMLEYDSNGDPAGGLTSINSTLEARVDLPADFELNCFIDTGRVDDLNDHMESRGFRSSVGTGLRYVTPIGPIGLLYGHKLNTEDGESAGRIHFSVGYTF